MTDVEYMANDHRGRLVNVGLLLDKVSRELHGMIGLANVLKNGENDKARFEEYQKTVKRLHKKIDKEIMVDNFIK